MRMPNAMAMAVSMVLVCGTQLLVGCEKTQEKAKEQAAEAQDKATELAGKASDKAVQSLEALKAEYVSQVENMSEKITTLKGDAAKFKDTQLDGYIAQLEGMVGEIESKLGEPLAAESVQSLKDHMTNWMSKVNSVYDKAAARVKELGAIAGG